MPHYPTSNYGPGITSSWNNDVTRRLASKDRVAFAQSSRFGGQWMEPKAALTPYGGTIMDAVGAVQQLASELNQLAPILPDLGQTVILSSVGVATNLLKNNVGVAVSFIGDMKGTIGTALTIDGVGMSTGLRVLFYGLSTASLNGVYTVQYNNPDVLSAGVTTLAVPLFTFARSNDLSQWWQFVKPKVFLATSGTNNNGKVYALATDAWESGNNFSIAGGTALTTLQGSSITFTLTSFDPTNAANISDIYPAYSTAAVQNTGEYDFLAQDSLAKFTYLKNRARRMAYQLFKLRENYSPETSSYQTNVVRPISGLNTSTNIGYSTWNNLPAGSRYPSSFNRGF